jgi:hypothetical protein
MFRIVCWITVGKTDTYKIAYKNIGVYPKIGVYPQKGVCPKKSVCPEIDVCPKIGVWTSREWLFHLSGRLGWHHSAKLQTSHWLAEKNKPTMDGSAHSIYQGKTTTSSRES